MKDEIKLIETKRKIQESEKIEKLEKKIGYVFKNKSLLLRATIHSSFAKEEGIDSYERLEFLGDSILGFVIADNLFRLSNKNLAEGRMTKTRAYIVNEDSLYLVSKKLELYKYILAGKSQGKSKIAKSVLADVVESIIAAIYLDSNMDNASKFIIENLKERIEEAINMPQIPEYKSILQEYAKEKKISNLEYVLISEKGPDHAKEFEFALFLEGKEISRGIGKTKKEAQSIAAKIALEMLNKI